LEPCRIVQFRRPLRIETLWLPGTVAVINMLDACVQLFPLSQAGHFISLTVTAARHAEVSENELRKEREIKTREEDYRCDSPEAQGVFNSSRCAQNRSLFAFSIRYWVSWPGVHWAPATTPSP
jgi:hypothetical protein